jgi:hypothetical protein
MDAQKSTLRKFISLKKKSVSRPMHYTQKNVVKK